MTEEPAQWAGEKDPVALLVQAVNQLPAGDRDEIFAWLLRVGWRHYSPPAVMFPPRRGEDPAAMLRIFQAARPGSVQQPVSQVVPVRFPADQHAQLREWCAQHGFSMATVIRGLVGKFLEDQLPEHS
jgi:hypothetical protein